MQLLMSIHITRELEISKFQQTISFSTAVIHNNFDNQQTGDFFLGGHGGFEKGGHDNAGWRASESLLQAFYLFVTY